MFQKSRLRSNDHLEEAVYLLVVRRDCRFDTVDLHRRFFQLQEERQQQQQKRTRTATSGCDAWRWVATLKRNRFGVTSVMLALYFGIIERFFKSTKSRRGFFFAIASVIRVTHAVVAYQVLFFLMLFLSAECNKIMKRAKLT